MQYGLINLGLHLLISMHFVMHPHRCTQPLAIWARQYNDSPVWEMLWAGFCVLSCLLTPLKLSLSFWHFLGIASIFYAQGVEDVYLMVFFYILVYSVTYLDYTVHKKWRFRTYSF